MRSWRPALLLVMLLAVPALAAFDTGAVGFQERARHASVGVETRAWPVWDADGNPLGTATWRIAAGTGNCCENYLALTANGRMIDLGGDRPLYSDNEGHTWREVSHTLLPITGEGAVAVAPNGDALAVTWDAYFGDRLLTWKFTAATGEWTSGTVALHHPLYDRPWLGVIPGPIEILGQTFPYVALMQSNFFDHDLSYSVDGLNYLPLELTTPPRQILDRTYGIIDEPLAAWSDDVQPISEMGLLPLPSGGALLRGAAFGGCEFLHIRTDLSTGCFDLQGYTIASKPAIRLDSQGRLHQAYAPAAGVGTPSDRLAYRMSEDGGATWTERVIRFPAGTGPANGQLDLVARGDADAAAIAYEVVDAHRDVSRIEVLKITDLSSDEWTLRRYQVGDGDQRFGQGVSGSNRLDFITTVMWPDGTVATTFRDQAHRSPAVAIHIG